jgi:lipopolysaccharide heptosyltransferase I
VKLLIVKTSSLGDIIHTFPVVAYLRRRFPDAQIDWVVERPYAELIQAHPLVDRVLTIHSKRWRKGLIWPRVWKEMRAFRRALKGERYDCLFDLQGNCKSGLVTWWARAKEKVGLAKCAVAEWPNLLVTRHRYAPRAGNIRHDLLSLVQEHYDDNEAFFDSGVDLQLTGKQQEMVDEMVLPGQVLIHPGSAQANKELPLDLLIPFLERAQKSFGFEYLFGWGSDSEAKLAEELQERIPQGRILPRMPIPMLQNLMARVSLVISMDSLPLHLCGTTQTPSFSFFGPSSLSKYKPTGAQHHAIQGSCPYDKKFERRCPALRTCATAACMREYSADEIYSAFSNWWRQIQPPPTTSSPR